MNIREDISNNENVGTLSKRGSLSLFSLIRSFTNVCGAVDDFDHQWARDWNVLQLLIGLIIDQSMEDFSERFSLIASAYCMDQPPIWEPSIILYLPRIIASSYLIVMMKVNCPMSQMFLISLRN